MTKPIDDGPYDHANERDASAAAEREVLSRRAAELARPPAAESPGPALEVLEFRLGGARYGVTTNHVREVVAVDDPTPLPGAPPFVRGLVNVRGEIVSIVDLRPLIGLGADASAGRRSVIVMAGRDMVFGVDTDGVAGVVGIAGAAAAVAPAGAAPAFVDGLVDGDMALIDGGALLADRRLVVDDGEVCGAAHAPAAAAGPGGRA